jgi:protein involved in polysaccharide export with SLBB domain
MQSGEDAASEGWCVGRRAACALVVGLVFACGCATGGPRVHQVMQNPNPSPSSTAALEPYTLGCPDVLEVNLRGKHGNPHVGAVGVDGRIELGALGRVRVEGLTAGQAVDAIAEAAGVAPNWVRLRILEYKSRQIYLSGEVAGLHRTVPYRGPETVAELLQRVGGITPGAETGDVHVIRSHITDGGSPEDFHVDLRAITLGHDDRTNLVLRPFDQIYVGESRKARFTKCFPRWLQPAYEGVAGLKRDGR